MSFPFIFTGLLPSRKRFTPPIIFSMFLFKSIFNKFAPIKNIFKNKSKDEYEVIELLEDINRDLMNYDLEHRIQELESKFSKDLSEATFNQLKELKKKQNIN